MNKKIFLILLLAIFLLAFGLRFYKLGSIPPALDWDETSIGYNSYAISQTGNDEYGNFLPISIRSFNDYKASVYSYLSVLPIILFGLNEFSVRFVSAFFGSLTVILAYFLFHKILSLDERIKAGENIALVAAFFLAICPWHLQFSRAAFEANLSLFFFMLATLIFLYRKQNVFLLPLAFFFWGVTLFTYHSAKIVVPLFVLSLFIFNRREILKEKISLILSIPVVFFFGGLLFYSTKIGGQARFFSTSIFSQTNNFFGYLSQIIANYLAHFDINFLFITGDLQARHHAPGIGQLYWFDLFFIIIGLVILVKKKFKANYLIFSWILLAPLASSLTLDVPNAVRDILAIPVFCLVSAIGFYYLFGKKLGKMLIIIVFLGLVYYLHQYFIHGPLETSQSWQYGYKEIVRYYNENKENYDQVLVTNHYDQPYIYFLFYQDPLKVVKNNGEFYQGFDKLKFRPINWSEDKNLSRTLIIGFGEEIPDNDQIISKILFTNNDVAFVIAKSGL